MPFALVVVAVLLIVVVMMLLAVMMAVAVVLLVLFKTLSVTVPAGILPSNSPACLPRWFQHYNEIMWCC